MTLKGLIDERNMRRSKNLIKRESDERQKGTKNLKSLPVTVWIWQCQLDYLSLWVNPRGFQSAKVNAKVRLLARNLDIYIQTFLCRTLIFLSLISKWSRSSFISDDTRFFSCVAWKRILFSTRKLKTEELFRLAPPIKSRLYQFRFVLLEEPLEFSFQSICSFVLACFEVHQPKSKIEFLKYVEVYIQNYTLTSHLNVLQDYELSKLVPIYMDISQSWCCILDWLEVLFYEKG